MKFVIQWFINFDEASYETLIEYDVDEVTNADDVPTWMDEHMHELNPDQNVPFHAEGDIDMDWEFFEGTIADLSDNEIDDIQWFKDGNDYRELDTDEDYDDEDYDDEDYDDEYENDEVYLCQDKEVVLVALQHNTNALKHTDPKLQHDPDILMTAIKNDMLFGDVLMRAPEEYKRNKDIVLTVSVRMLGHFSMFMKSQLIKK